MYWITVEKEVFYICIQLPIQLTAVSRVFMISSINSFNSVQRQLCIISITISIKTATSLTEKGQPLDLFTILQLNPYQSPNSLSLYSYLLYPIAIYLPPSIVSYSLMFFAVSEHNRIAFLSNRHWLALRVGCTLGWFRPTSLSTLLSHSLSLCKRATSAAVWFSSMKFMHMPLKWTQLAL